MCVRDEIKDLLEKTKSVVVSHPHSEISPNDTSFTENQGMVSQNIQKDSLK